MKEQFQKEKDNILLKQIYHEIKTDLVLQTYYPFNKVLDDVNINVDLITYCQDENKHTEVLNLIIQLLEDVLFELDKSFRKDKDKIWKMLCSLHNLPRVYLSNDANTLCMLRQKGITVCEAFSYSKLSMDENMLSNYKDFLV